MQIKSYGAAINYLGGFIGKVIFKVDKEFLKHHDPLERMRVLLGLLGNPQEKFKSVLVGGTSGKGSTAYLISHILTTSGYKTGLTISPHLQKINERVQINGKSISDGEFTNLLASILDSIEGMRKMDVGVPSYFEILIAMAFLYFVQQKVDIAVVEVGMGGEFDGTNTLNPLIAVLTNVGLDHTNILGKTVEKIAKTKAGIIKKLKINPSTRFAARRARSGQKSKIDEKELIVVTGAKQASVIKVVEERCERAGARLFRLGKDFNYKIKKESIRGSIFDLTTARGRGLQLNNLELTLMGNYQVENASLAIEVVLNLGKFGFKVSNNAIRKALNTSFFPGRFEVINYTLGSKRYTLVLDGAHNPTKMKAFTYSLKTLYPKVKKIFIVGFKFDKDMPEMLQQITKVADKIIVTEFNRATDMSKNASADALKIKDQILKIKYDGEVVVEKDSKKALDKALIIQQFNKSTIIVVTGSLYLVGEVRSKISLF